MDVMKLIDPLIDLDEGKWRYEEMRVREDTTGTRDALEQILLKLIVMSENDAVQTVEVREIKARLDKINGKVGSHEKWINERQAQMGMIWGAITASGALCGIVTWVVGRLLR